MPAKVSIDRGAFKRFSGKMRNLGFRPVASMEFKSDFVRLGFEAPRPREGREVGFIFHANGLEVRVWTTFLNSEGRERDSDEGWVLIKDGDWTRYFSHPMRRTEHFLRRLYQWAQVARLRVLNRPLCPVCNARMSIAYGWGKKARYWSCVASAYHSDRRSVHQHWDIGLPSKALAFVLAERKERARYTKMLRAQGKKRGKAQEHRLRWKVTRPENIVPAR